MSRARRESGRRGHSGGYGGGTAAGVTTVDHDVIADGELVRLRRKRPHDAYLDWTWRRDVDLASLDATRTTTLSFEQFRNQYLWQLQRNEIYRSTFAIEDLEGRHIGNVMYYNVDRQSQEAELGVLIGDRDYWGGGYGREAVSLLIDFVFTTTAFRRVYLHTLDWNVRAQKAFRAAGFKDCGRARRGRQRFHIMEVRREWLWERQYQLRGIPRDR